MAFMTARRLAAIIALAALGFMPAAAETFVEIGGGTVAVLDAPATDVRLSAQTIRLYLHADGYTADASFIFHNPGPAVSHQVGFPQFSRGIGRTAALADLQFWIDDHPVTAAYMPGGPDELGWFVTTVNFPAGGTIATRVRFRAPYGRDRLLHVVEYLCGTGIPWAGPIGTTALHVYNSCSTMWVDSMGFDGEVQMAVVSVGRTGFEAYSVDLDPAAGDVLRLAVEPVPWWLRTVPCEGDEWYYSRAPLSPEYLRLLTIEQLGILRNTFYARRGLDFGDGRYGAYFGRFPWYEPRVRRTEGLLNPIELENVRMVVAEEERRRTIPVGR